MYGIILRNYQKRIQNIYKMYHFHIQISYRAAVSRTFKTIQTINESVTIEDHDFPVSSKMKLIPSVYLIINSADSSNTL